MVPLLVGIGFQSALCDNVNLKIIPIFFIYRKKCTFCITSSKILPLDKGSNCANALQHWSPLIIITIFPKLFIFLLLQYPIVQLMALTSSVRKLVALFCRLYLLKISWSWGRRFVLNYYLAYNQLMSIFDWS